MSGIVTPGELGIRLASETDALDVLAQGAAGCLVTADVDPAFWALENGMAGAVLQKFVNYRFPVAFVLADDHGFGPRVTELARDHATHPCVRFFADETAARAWLEAAAERLAAR